MYSAKKGNAFMFFLLIYFLFLSSNIGNILFFKFFKYNLPIYIFFCQFIQFSIPFLIYILFTKTKIKEILLFKPLNIKNIILIILMAFSIQPFMMLLSGISSLFFENDVPVVVKHITKFPFYLGLFAIAFTPAFFEEIAFRGIIFKEYENINIKKTALVNGLFFGIMHLNLQQFLYATILGIFLTYLVYYTKSIFSSMLFHFVVNGTQFSMSYLFLKLKPNNMNDYTENSNITNSILAISFISIIFIPIFIYLLKKFISYNRPKEIKNNEKEKIIDIYFILNIILYLGYALFYIYF